MVLFILYIFCILIGGSIFIGPISIRVLATCLMTADLAFTYRTVKHQLKIDKSYLKIYVIFSICMGLALLVNGEFYEYDFIKKFLSFNFVSIIAFLAIDKYVNTEKRIIALIISLVSLIAVDDIVTILQFMHNPIGWIIGNIFGDIDQFANTADAHSSLLGMSITPGIFRHSVNNAFYIAMIAPLSFAILGKNTKIYQVVFCLGVFILSTIAIYMTQQRMAFSILLFSLCAFLLITLKKHPVIIIVISLLCIAITSYYGSFIDNIDFGRLSQTEDKSRIQLVESAIDFIIKNPLFGGPISFQNQAGLSSHNIILDSYIFSGFLGFIVMMILYAKTIIKSFERVKTGFKSKTDNHFILFLGLSLLSCMLYGLTHNTSYLTGEVLVFILLALVLKSEKFT